MLRYLDKPSLAFWETKTLQQMEPAEWEALCDGCAQCCLIKLEDADSNQLFVTNVACQQLNVKTCRCRDYSQRAKRIDMCLIISLEKPEIFEWLPKTCAYRCLYEGRSLPDWHPLISKYAGTVHEIGISVKAYAVSEAFIHPEQIEQHVIGEL